MNFDLCREFSSFHLFYNCNRFSFSFIFREFLAAEEEGDVKRIL